MLEANCIPKTTPLTDRFGVEVHDFDLTQVRTEDDFRAVRVLFDEHSAMLFRNQDLTDEDHIRLSKFFGPIEDRLADERKPGEAYKVPEVSNIREDGTVAEETDLHALNLKSNFLWHSDSTFLPVPSLVNVIAARIVPSSGGATELASTRAAWAEMPLQLKARIEGRGIWHRFSHSRKKISEELIAELIEFCTRPRYVYSHGWTVGDVLMWDQRAVMHRGTPWPFEEPRKLSSICSSARDSDGLSSIRM